MYIGLKRPRLSDVFGLRRSKAKSLASATVGLISVFVLSACGSDPGATITTLRPLTSTNYATTPPAVVTTPNVANTQPEVVYTVKAGDSVYGIAAQYKMNPEELESYNNWPEGVLHSLIVGETVLIPASAIQTTTLPGLPLPVETTSAPPGPGQGTYIVQAGDSISKIADKWGVEVSALLLVNGWADQSVVIVPGDEIRIPAQTKDPKPS
jgi:LysM repeat protein